ncbi:MAG: serine--tRNA ligase, partial [Deltaproteobacteria bacterium]|nr:serine--tRNA ligase [Deltaproteobacteria bacterium]
MRRRGPDVAQQVETYQGLNHRRKSLQASLDELRAERNAANQAMAKADKKSEEFVAMRDKLRSLSQDIKKGEAELGELETQTRDLLLVIPNAPAESAPDGADESDNAVVSSWGQKPSFDFDAKPHWDIGEALGILDFETASKLSGARFCVLKGDGARLNRALINLMVELHAGRGYQ